MELTQQKAAAQPPGNSRPIIIFMCGDVMTGRGIDQILPHPCDPLIYEPYVRSAKGYVEIAEQASGPIPKPVDFSYIWGDALAELERVKPDVRMINLETAVTQSEEWEEKGINYRMHPDNAPCIAAAKIDCCVLANNHVLDWGYPGLLETLATLKKWGLRAAGAGRNIDEAEAPAMMAAKGKGRVIVFSYGLETSGIPRSWAAAEDRGGVNLLRDLSDRTVQEIEEKVRRAKRFGDVVVASIHWGANWGYQIPVDQTAFAHRLIDDAGVDIIHGHSSHHAKGIEVYRGKLILYGCGDFLNDYEGIGGHQAYRGDLGLMYFVSVEPASGRLMQLKMTPTQIKHFKVNQAATEDALWLRDILNREGRKFGTRAELSADSTLTLQWDSR